MNKDILIISTSLNSSSNSRKLARHAFELLKDGGEVDWIDLKEYSLPHCDGETCYGDPSVKELAERIKSASCVLMAVPIYNYDVGSAAKNLIELTGQAWNEKIVGFLCAAGGRASYMSVMGLANSLMLDFRCLIIPRFVYAEDSAFAGEIVTDSKIASRIDELVRAAQRLKNSLAAAKV